MRIAVISNSAFSLLNFRQDLMIALLNSGHEVFAFAPDYDEKTRSLLNDLGVTAINFNMFRAKLNPYHEVKTILELRRHFIDLDIEMSFSYFLKPVIYSSIAGYFSRVKRIISMIEGLGFAFTSSTEFNLKRYVSKFVAIYLLKVAGRLSDAVIVLNNEDLADLKKWKITQITKLHLLGPIGVNLQDWSTIKSFPDRLTFIMAARLIKEKGVENFLEAAKALHDQNVNAHFILLGGVDDHPSCVSDKKIRSYVDAGFVEWPGHVDVKKWLAKGSVFVLPSFYREGVPRSIQEAMVAGLSVITTNVPGCKECVEHGKTGYLIPPRNTDALISAMLEFVADKEKISIMGHLARNFAVEHFDVVKQNEKLIGIMLNTK